MLVLVFFAEAKAQLLERLAKTDAYSVYLQEQVSFLSSVQVGEMAKGEEEMLLDSFGEDKVIYLRQAHGFLKWKRDKSLPVIVYNRSLQELAEQEDGHPVIWFLSSEPRALGLVETLDFEGVEIKAKVRQMPESIQGRLQFDNAVAFPLEMAEFFLNKGFSIHIMASLDSLEEVQKFNLMTGAYYTSQRRMVRNFSSVDLLHDIQKMDEFQSYIRIGIVLSCGIILACILGSLAWLEYRQESYLLALLKSFGAPVWMLFIHSFFENMILVSLGLVVTFFSWKSIYLALTKLIADVSFRPVSEMSVESADISIIFISALVSVFLAVIPVGVGLRKQTGLILQ